MIALVEYSEILFSREGKSSHSTETEIVQSVRDRFKAGRQTETPFDITTCNIKNSDHLDKQKPLSILLHVISKITIT